MMKATANPNRCVPVGDLDKCGEGVVDAYEALKTVLEDYGGAVGGESITVTFKEALTISSRNTLTVREGTTLYLDENLTIASGGTLTILPGTTVKFAPNKMLNVARTFKVLCSQHRWWRV